MMAAATGATTGVSPALYEAAADLLRSRTGLVFSDTGKSRLSDALEAELARRGRSSPVALLARLQTDPAALDALAVATTVGESYFFRDAPQFHWLRHDLLPSLCARRSEGGLRVWSAGCSSGEEPYSIAILLRELGHAGPATIVGSDLSPRSLLLARRAVYTRWSLRAVQPQIVSRWFRHSLGDFALDRTIRDKVTFVRHNLAVDAFPPPESGLSEVDLILCRNVLIYFDRPTVTRVAECLLGALGADGWLVLGASDPPIAELVPCEAVVSAAGIAYRRLRTSPSDVDERALPVEIVPVDASLTAELSRPVWDAELSQMPTATPEARDATEEPAAERGTMPDRRLAGTADEIVAHIRERYAERDYQSAASMAEIALGRQPGSEFLWVIRIRSLANLGELHGAGLVGAMAGEQCPHSAELAYVTAVLQASAGRHADAVAAARRALYLDHSLVVAHVMLGASLRRMGDVAGALRAFSNAAELLRAMPPTTVVRAGDGETAGAILAHVRTLQQLSGKPSNDN